MGQHSYIIPAAPPPASRRRRPETLPKGGHKTFLQSILERHGNDGDDAADVLWVWNKWCWKIYLQVGRLHSLVTFLIGSQRRTTKDMKSTPNSHRRHCRFGVHLYDNILTCVPLDGSELGSECCDPRRTWWCWCSRKFPISERDNSTLVSSKFNYNSSSSAKIHLQHFYYSRMSVVLDDWLPLNYMGATYMHTVASSWARDFLSSVHARDKDKAAAPSIDRTTTGTVHRHCRWFGSLGFISM